MNPNQLFVIGFQPQNTFVLASGAVLSVEFYLDYLIFQSCCNFNIMSTMNLIPNLVLAQLLYLTSTVEAASAQLQNLEVAGLLPSSPTILVLKLLLNALAGDLSPSVVWSRMCLIQSGDVETNPGPVRFKTCTARSSPEEFVYTDKNVSKLILLFYYLLV